MKKELQAHMQNYSPIATFMAIKVTLAPTDNNLVNATKFRALVGNIHYLTLIT